MIEPRGLSKASAATYLGVTPETFSRWIAEGILPGPIPGTHRWDRKAIDAALDKHAGLTAQSSSSAYDRWKAGQDARAP